MMLTEQDAKTKQCRAGGVANMARPTCVASECMFWRWNVVTRMASLATERSAAKEEGFAAFRTTRNSSGDITIMRKQTEFGWCGLAGRPKEASERKSL